MTNRNETFNGIGIPLPGSEGILQRRPWRVGDIVIQDGRNWLVLYLDYDDTRIEYVGLIDEHGESREFQQHAYSDAPPPFRHHANLTYAFINWERARQDHQAGKFAACFAGPDA